jgi:transcription antitermination factor NusB
MIHERATARRIALQALYQLDVQGDAFVHEGLKGFIDQASEEPRVRDIAYFMAKSAWAFRATADEWLGRIARDWPVHRMAVVDRNILRLAAWELVNYSETPARVVLDEAINMGKEFSTADSGNFINGILDALFKEIQSRAARAPE